MNSTLASLQKEVARHGKKKSPDTAYHSFANALTSVVVTELVPINTNFSLSGRRQLRKTQGDGRHGPEVLARGGNDD
jgi:hypothetical protein